MSYVDPGYALNGYFGSVGSLARFQLGMVTINFEQPPLRVPTDLELLQTTFSSAGGMPFALAPLAEEELLQLRWPRMFRYYRDRLVDFFANTADGMNGVFDYRDPVGQVLQVRFSSPDLPEIREVAIDRFVVDVSLLVAT
jgi:hypothetical protein